MSPVFLAWTSEEEALFNCPPIIRNTPSGRVCFISPMHCTCHHVYCFARLNASISAILGSRPGSLLCYSDDNQSFANSAASALGNPFFIAAYLRSIHALDSSNPTLLNCFRLLCSLVFCTGCWPPGLFSIPPLNTLFI